MLVVSALRFEQALEFIDLHARPIDKALTRYRFGDGDVEAVRAALTLYRNADGGFGHGLEPDFLLPDSSVMATTVALHVLAEIGASADDVLVEGAVRFMLSARDAGVDGWPPVPPAVNDWPHAPWWHYDVDKPPTTDAVRLNPGADAVGHLMRWRSLVPDHVPVDSWLEQTVAQFRSAEPLEPHELLCVLRLVSVPGLNTVHRTTLLERAMDVAPAMIETNAARWDGYCIKPLTAVPHPEAPLADTLADAVRRQLDYEIERQGGDGSWRPHWSWYGHFADAWQRVEPQLCGMVTLETLSALKAWGRISQSA
jgi:hypothetical protein